jgi:hypothetical protein
MSVRITTSFGHYGQTVLFLFHQTIGHFSKKYDLCLRVQTVICLFLWRFWSSGFFLTEWPFMFCQYGTHFTVDIDTFASVSSSIFTRSFAVVLGLIFSFRTKVRSSLGDRTRLLPERYDGCVVPWCLYCLYRWTWYLQAFGNFSQGCTRLVEVYNFFLRSWLISFDFPMMSSKEALSLKVGLEISIQNDFYIPSYMSWHLKVLYRNPA